MLTSFVISDVNSFFVTRKCQIFRKDVSYDNIKSHKKPEFHPPFRRYIFQDLRKIGNIRKVFKLHRIITYW